MHISKVYAIDAEFYAEAWWRKLCGSQQSIDLTSNRFMTLSKCLFENYSLTNTDHQISPVSHYISKLPKDLLIPTLMTWLLKPNHFSYSVNRIINSRQRLSPWWSLKPDLRFSDILETQSSMKFCRGIMQGWLLWCLFLGSLHFHLKRVLSLWYQDWYPLIPLAFSKPQSPQQIVRLIYELVWYTAKNTILHWWYNVYTWHLFGNFQTFWGLSIDVVCVLKVMKSLQNKGEVCQNLVLHQFRKLYE